MLCSHFIQNTTNRPYINLLIVLLIVDQFWRHVIRRAYMSLWEDAASHHLAESKISQLDSTVLIQEYVARLDVTVYNLVIS